MANLFLSHSEKDKVFATSLLKFLQSHKYHSLFLDVDPEHGLQAGSLWERELYRKINASDAVLALCSPASMASQWCFAEIALGRLLGKIIIPVKISPCEVNKILCDYQIIEVNFNTGEGLDRLVTGLRLKGLDPFHSIQCDPTRIPYPGLHSFDERDAGYFFGREGEIRQALEILGRLRVKRHPRLAMVVGASGSGKSSLVKAGIIPRLRQDAEHWKVLAPFRPGQAPIRSLAQSLAQMKVAGFETPAWGEIRDRLLKGDDQAAEYLISILESLVASGRPGECAVLLVVDQWEELLGVTVSQDVQREHAAFQYVLRGALEASESPLIALGTIRSDIFESFQQDTHWVGLEREVYDLGPMPHNRYSFVVEGPAKSYGVAFQSGLATRLVNDAGADGTLPLLAFTLRELFERCTNGQMTIEAYENQLGGIKGAISHAVDQAIGANLSRENELILHKTFINHMVGLNDEERYLRKKARWDELENAAHPLIDKFISARLIISDGSGPQRTIEIVHEVLFDVWDQLKKWLDESHELLVWRKSITAGKTAWEKHPEEERLGYLLTGAHVSEARAWHAQHADDFDEVERRYIEASIAADERRILRERRRSRFGKATAIGFALLVLVAAIAVWYQRNEAAEHRKSQLAEIRLIQDTAGKYQQLNDEGTAAVLLVPCPV